MISTAGTSPALPCGSSPSRGGRFWSGGAGVPKSHTTSAEPGNGNDGTGSRPKKGSTAVARPSRSAGWRTCAPIVRDAIVVPTFAT